MATFPTAPEIQRPVPQVGASIPTARATPIGLEGARAMEVAGQQFQELAVLTDRYAQRLDEADAQDALNKLAAKRAELTADPDKGFARLRGKAAMGEGPDGQPISKSFSSAFDLEREALGSKLSARARQAYEARASRESLAFKIDLVKHQTDQADKYMAATYVGEQAINLNRAAQSYKDDDALDTIATNAGIAARKNAIREGKDGPFADAAAVEAESKVRSSALILRIAEGDPSAIGYFEKHKDKFDANDRRVLESSIKTLRTNEEGKDLAATAGSGDYDARNKYHESRGGKMIPNDLGSGAYGPYQFLPDTWADVRAKNPGLNLPADMRKATEAQHDIAHEAFKAGNAEFLQRKGVPTTDANMYLAHRFGAGGAVSVVMADPSTPLSKILPPEWAAQNPDMRGQTAGSFIQLANRRMGGADRVTWKKGGDPLAKQVNAGTASVERDEKKDQGYDYDSVGKAEGPRGFLDTRKMKIDAEIWHRDATAEIAASSASLEAKKTAQHLIDVQFGQRKAAVQLAKDQLNDAVQDWVTKPDPKTGKAQTDRPPPPIWNQLSYEQQRSVDATLKHNAEGTKAATKPDVYYAWVKGLSDPDLAERQKWIDKDLLVDKPNLADEQFRSIADKQATARKGDPDAKLAHGETITKKGDRRLKEIGIETGAKATKEQLERAGDFHLELERKVREQQRAQNNKPLEPEQVDKIIRDMTYEVTGSGGWFSRNLGVGSNKRAFEVPNADPSRLVVKMKDIPVGDLAKITEALKAEGIPPTDENIIDRYRRVRLGVKR
jgi:hypothetical protein